ncbi:MAG: DEAD/DEAH box helicase [Spirochaetaceae bacterium]|nr:DEAD/DEAH box helicase [Spirochaetaceae bacterium]
MNEIQLYEWQEKCIAKWFDSNCRGIAEVATGGGKTFLAIYAALKLQKVKPNLKIKIIVPKAFLVNQWRSCLIEDFYIDKQDIGCYYGKEKCLSPKLFMIYVINSARYTLALQILEESKKGHSHLLILDECHHYSSQENSKIFEFLSKKRYNSKQYFSLGLSATPRTITFSSTIEKFIGPIFYKYSITEAMDDNIINGCVLYNVKLKFTDKELKLYTEVSEQISKSIGILYTLFPEKSNSKMNKDQFLSFLKKLIRIGEGDASNLAKSIIHKFLLRQNILYNASSRLSAVVGLVDILAENKKVMIFTERITQTNALFSILNEKYIGKIARYHSGMEESEKQFSLESYRIGHANILITCKALDEGLNIPSTDIGIILSGNSQERQRIQRLGRILRKVEGKTLSSLFYCYLGDSVEKNFLLDASFKEDREFDIKFDIFLKSFTFPYYVELTLKMLKEIKVKDKSLLPLFSNYLNEGTYKNDWLESLSYIEKQLIETTDLDRKNYWYCMKKLNLFRKRI